MNTEKNTNTVAEIEQQLKDGLITRREAARKIAAIKAAGLKNA